MAERISRKEENEKTKENKPIQDIKSNNPNKYDAEFGAIEIPNEIPPELLSGKGKVICTDTAEGVIGDISDFEQDPMRIDKKY